MYGTVVLEERLIELLLKQMVLHVGGCHPHSLGFCEQPRVYLRALLEQTCTQIAQLLEKSYLECSEVQLKVFQPQRLEDYSRVAQKSTEIYRRNTKSLGTTVIFYAQLA